MHPNEAMQKNGRALSKGCQVEGASRETPFFRVARGDLKEGLSVRDEATIENTCTETQSKPYAGT